MAQVTGALHNMRISDDLSDKRISGDLISDNVHGSVLSPGRKFPAALATLADTRLDSGHALDSSSSADHTPASDLALVRKALTIPETPSAPTGTLPEQTYEVARACYSMQQLLGLRDKCTAEPNGNQWQIVQAPQTLATCVRETECPMVTMMEGLRKQPARRYNKKPQPPNSPSQIHNKANSGSPVRPSLPKSLNRGTISSTATGYDSVRDHLRSNLHIRNADNSPATSVALPASATSVASTNSTAMNFFDSNSSTPTAAAEASFWNEQKAVVSIKALVAQLSDPDPESVAQAAGHLAHMCAASVDDQDLVRQQQAIPILTRLLQSRDSDVQQLAAAALWSLSRGNPENQAVLVMNGALPRLVRLMGSRSSAMQYVAASALYVLIKDQKRLQDPAADAGAVQMLTHVLKAGSLTGKRVAAETLKVIVNENTKNQAELLKAGALKLLVDLLQPDISESADAALEIHDAAVSALLALMSSHQHHDAVAAAGARPLLLQVLKGSKGVQAVNSTQIKAVAALKQLDHNIAAVRPDKHVAAPLAQGNVLSGQNPAK